MKQWYYTNEIGERREKGLRVVSGWGGCEDEEKIVGLDEGVSGFRLGCFLVISVLEREGSKEVPTPTVCADFQGLRFLR
jgi:hypothetical protein